MKTPLAIGALLLSISTAQAATLSPAKIQSQLQALARNKVGVLADRQPAQPIREAKFRARVMKSTYTKQPNGGYQFVHSEVCKGEGTLNVYDLRNGGGVSDPSVLSRLVCDSTFDNQAVKVNVGGYVTLITAPIIDTTEDIKAVIPLLQFTVNNPNPPPYSFQIGISASRDLNARSFINVIEPLVTSSCTTVQPAPKPGEPTPPPEQKCSATVNEYFSAIVDIED